MAWRRPGDKPLSEPMMVCVLTHICVTRRTQWVNKRGIWYQLSSVLVNHSVGFHNSSFSSTLTFYWISLSFLHSVPTIHLENFIAITLVRIPYWITNRNWHSKLFTNGYWECNCLQCFLNSSTNYVFNNHELCLSMLAQVDIAASLLQHSLFNLSTAGHIYNGSRSSTGHNTN